jgi:PAS domain-containing protein
MKLQSDVIGLRNGAAKTAHHAKRSLKNAPRTVQEWLRLAAEGSDLGLWHWNERTQGLFWDRKTRDIFGVNLKGEVGWTHSTKLCTRTISQTLRRPGDISWRLASRMISSTVPCDPTEAFAGSMPVGEAITASPASRYT